MVKLSLNAEFNYIMYMMSLTSAWIATFCKIICNFNLSTLLKVIIHDNERE